MERANDAQRGRESRATGDVEISATHGKPAIEPESWKELTEFRDQFNDPILGLIAEQENGPERFWVVRNLEKVRPSAVPINQATTFDMGIVGPSGQVVDDLRLTIKEITHVRVADPSGVTEGSNEA